MVLTQPMVSSQTDGIVSVLLDHTCTRGPSVARMQDFFLIKLFFLQFAKFNLKAPPYSKTLITRELPYSRAPTLFRNIYSQDLKYSSRANVALEKCKILTFLCINVLQSRGEGPK